MVARQTRAFGAFPLVRFFSGPAPRFRKLATFVAALVTVFSAPAARAEQLSVFRLTPIDTPTVFYFQTRVIYCQGVPDFRLANTVTVVLPIHPSHGAVTTRDGVAPVAHCQGRLGYATIVTYTPERGFSGVDNFQLRVLYDLKSQTVLHNYNVRVQVGGRGNHG
jgi:hypothetical protein